MRGNAPTLGAAPIFAAAAAWIPQHRLNPQTLSLDSDPVPPMGAERDLPQFLSLNSGAQGPSILVCEPSKTMSVRQRCLRATHAEMISELARRKDQLPRSAQARTGAEWASRVSATSSRRVPEHFHTPSSALAGPGPGRFLRAEVRRRQTPWSARRRPAPGFGIGMP